MSATTTRTLIDQARADGVQIVVEDGRRVKLRGDPDAVAHWAAELRPYKSQIIEAAQAANDAHRPLPGVIVPAADPFDREQFGIECLSYLHAHGLVLALEAGQIVAHGIASPQIVEEAAALVELHRADLMSALQAQEAAQQAIQRAAVSCAQCRYLRASASARDRRPGCKAGHRLVYRTTATRTWPGRLDAQDCGDRQSGAA